MWIEGTAPPVPRERGRHGGHVACAQLVARPYRYIFGGLYWVGVAMNRISKRLQRMLRMPSDFTWDELNAVLTEFGFYENTKKGGSYRTFETSSGHKIFLHRPHPGNVLPKYAIRNVLGALREFGYISRN